ncbi:hypothetical protein [Halomarina oriensis]|uniref:hypothetical protein n=1 Tax=Halomarina oriensis TaxID=671145 RepID=UPI0034A1D99B
MSNTKPDIEFQTAFGEAGALEITETSVETSLEDFGATVDHRERERRLAQPVASEFGVDDRPSVNQRPESDQSKLVAREDRVQRTLHGSAAREPCRYEE